MVIVMRSASGSVLIGPILMENEPTYDGVCVEGSRELKYGEAYTFHLPTLKKAMPWEMMKLTMTMDETASFLLTIGFATKFCI